MQDRSQIVDEASALPESLVRAHFAAQRLAADVLAPVTIVVVVEHFQLDARPQVVHKAVAGMSSAGQKAQHDKIDFDLRVDPFLRELMIESARSFARDGSLFPIFTAQRQKLIADELWAADPFIRENGKHLGVEHSIATVCRLDGGTSVCGIFLCRAPGAPAFTDHEIHQTDTLMRQLASVLAPHWATLVGPKGSTQSSLEAVIASKLSPAQLPVLPYLLTNLTEQEIGEKLFRSKHTVHSHAKVIYAAAGVRGRRELLQLFAMFQGESARFTANDPAHHAAPAVRSDLSSRFAMFQ